MRNLSFLTIFFATLLVSCGTTEAQLEQIKSDIKKELSDMENTKSTELKAIAQRFYDALSTTPNDATSATTAEFMVNDWESTPTPAGGAGLEGFVKTLHLFHGMIPDLDWKVQEMLVDGNRVIVRSIATGTPNSPEGYFFGVPTDGSKSFEVQTIDIHTIEDGKFVRSYHTEDWATAIQQVSK